ncbi:putative Ufm1-specific protease 1 [Hypsibius exemplaris]|uniref:Ufm1-specific protease 1 n=1 Tax=Hypsibius exemplaris TaxID=2072580 RepID=A0A1W0X4L3_HYPEX|nr:putative Ufm1-specific protease 1 [Hypsibius exemplaris]
MNCSPKYLLIKNVHDGIVAPTEATDIVHVRGDYRYHHYLCDHFQDVGWGCGYRVLQTLCSWIDSESAPPSIPEMVGILNGMESEAETWNRDNSRTPWIGSYEGFLILDHVYDVSCRLLHIRTPAELKEHYATLQEHFTNSGSPIFLGGDKDCFGKCVIGMCKVEASLQWLILDPHYNGTLESPEDAVRKGCLKWTRTDELLEDSFYNLLLPLGQGRRKLKTSSPA